MEKIKVLSIDVGIINLGYVYGTISLGLPEQNKYAARIINNNYLNPNISRDITIIDCKRVNITHMKHETIPRCECSLHHSRCIPDYIDHFIQELPYFKECDVLIIEQQPPQGLMNVQDLLFKTFREKVLLIHPASIHTYFGLPKGGLYLERKAKSELIAKSYLSDFQGFDDERKHDMSDAMLMLIYYYKKRMEKIIDTKKSECLDFEQFRFKVIPGT